VHLDRIDTAEEIGPKKAFRWAVDWPGWCRAGRDSERALEAFIAVAPRYAVVATEADVGFPTDLGAVSAHDLVTLETLEGGAATDFGVPYAIGSLDRGPLDALAAARQARLVEAAWTVLDRIVETAPPELRKGPRGGGRDRDRIVEHVLGAEHAYAREMGLKLEAPSAADPAAVAAMRRAMLDVLGAPTDGSVLAGRKWTSRYAARRVAWHALDHAWEIEDRSTPQG
jgi:hypothetical protein